MTIERKEYYTVEYSELETLIKEALDIEYEILPYEEVGGDNCYIIQNVDNRGWGTYEKEILADLRAGKSVVFSLATLMHALHRGGHISAGEYLIDCSH